MDSLETKLAEYDGKDKVVSSIEILKQIEAEGIKYIEIKSGMPSMDDTLGGFEGGEVTVISGISGNGKTLMAQTLTINFEEQAIPCLWFSFEVLARSFLRSFGNSLPLFYMPTQLKINSLNWLEARIQESILKYGVRVVFIDHLHFLIDIKTRHNISLEIGFVMRTLKRIAIKYNLCIFLIAHTTKIRPEKELDLEDTRDSSFVGQEADNVLMIWRKKDTDTEAYIKIVKNRKKGLYKKFMVSKIGNKLQEITVHV